MTNISSFLMIHLNNVRVYGYKIWIGRKANDAKVYKNIQSRAR